MEASNASMWAVSPASVLRSGGWGKGRTGGRGRVRGGARSRKEAPGGRGRSLFFEKLPLGRGRSLFGVAGILLHFPNLALEVVELGLGRRQLLAGVLDRTLLDPGRGQRCL